MKIGVELRLGDGDPGELLADARAFEAAGADSVWVVAREGQEPWILGAALAAVTWRVRLVVVAVDRAEARATLERVSRGRLRVGERNGDAILIPEAEAASERWALSEMPAGRAEWKALRADREAAGFAGIVLPNDPRLLDLVRNPDVEDDRQDLKLAFG
jgi:hypothetical protein